jgi:Spy/CpxP family protein refolding chaperone
VRSKSILILAAAMLCAISMFGQPAIAAAKGVPAKQVQRSQHGGDAMVKALNLNKNQVAKLRRINQGAQKQIMALKVDKKLSQAQKSAKMRSIIMAVNQKSMAVLTPAQVAKLKQLRTAQKCKQR